MIRIPNGERHTVFLVNRVEGLVVHFGAATEPACRIGWPPLRPMFASWFIEDVTCKRCAKFLSLERGGQGRWKVSQEAR